MLEWREDYSHVDRSDIEQGFKALDLHSIRIERHYTEECMENNRRAAEELKSLYGTDSEAWLARCEQAVVRQIICTYILHIKCSCFLDGMRECSKSLYPFVQFI